jgi:hypothetical protein
MQAGVYQMSDLKVAGQAKNRMNWVVDDLLATPRAEAQARDVVAIVEGDRVTVLAPTGSLSAALKAVKAEREAKGI